MFLLVFSGCSLYFDLPAHDSAEPRAVVPDTGGTPDDTADSAQETADPGETGETDVETGADTATDTGGGTSLPSACSADVLDAAPCAAGVAAWIAGTTFPTVQAALDAAAPGDTVAICPGTWTENLTVPAMELSVRGYGNTTSVIDGGGVGVVMTVGTGATLTLEEVGLVNGVNPTLFGGGLTTWDADLVTCGVRFQDNMGDQGAGLGTYAGTWQSEGDSFVDNVATWGGGGAYVHGATATVVGATFSGNAAHSGGGIYFDWDWGPFAIRDSAFDANTADYEGGAIALSGDGSLSGELQGVVFTDNSALDTGGAISTGAASADIALTLDECDFERNAAGHSGGAIKLNSWGIDTLVVTDSQFIDNVATIWSGGAIDLDDYADATLTDCTLDGNSAVYGGAVGMLQKEGTTLVLSGGAVTANTATGGAGLSLAEEASVTASVTDVDFGTGATDNTPDDVWGSSAWGAGATFTCSGWVCM